MADLIPKESKKPAPPEAAKAPEPVASEPQSPIEITALNKGVSVKIEGDFVTLEISKYIADYISNYRSSDRIRVRYKHGASPDITGLNVDSL